MTYYLVTLTPFKITSLNTNALLSLPFPFWDVLLGGYLLNHSHFICCVCNAVPYHLKYSGSLIFSKPENSLQGIVTRTDRLWKSLYQNFLQF